MTKIWLNGSASHPPAISAALLSTSSGGARVNSAGPSAAPPRPPNLRCACAWVRRFAGSSLPPAARLQVARADLRTRGVASAPSSIRLTEQYDGGEQLGFLGLALNSIVNWDAVLIGQDHRRLV